MAAGGKTRQGVCAGSLRLPGIAASAHAAFACSGPAGGRIPETRGAFFLLLGGRESQVLELPLVCSLSSHHSVTQTQSQDHGAGPPGTPPPW